MVIVEKYENMIKSSYWEVLRNTGKWRGEYLKETRPLSVPFLFRTSGKVEKQAETITFQKYKRCKRNKKWWQFLGRWLQMWVPPCEKSRRSISEEMSASGDCRSVGGRGLYLFLTCLTFLHSAFSNVLMWVVLLVSLVAFVWLFSSVRFQMCGSVGGCGTCGLWPLSWNVATIQPGFLS